MTTRFNPFPKRNTAYGAPLGRMSVMLDPELPLEALAVAGPAGEYDSGGAYWGSSAEGPVWAVWQRGKGRDGVTYVRAHSRYGARVQAMRHARNMD